MYPLRPVETRWDSVGPTEIHRDSLGPIGTQWDPSGPLVVFSEKNMGPVGTHRDSLGPVGTPRGISDEKHGTRRDPLRPTETRWDPLGLGGATTVLGSGTKISVISRIVIVPVIAPFG